MARAPVVETEPVRWWIAAAVVAAALWFLPVPPWVVDEFYSRDLYPWLQNVVTFFSNLVPIAVMDVMIGLAVALTLFRAFRLARLAWRRSVLDAILESGKRIVRAVAIVLILFVGEWGCNYRRLPLETTLANGTAVQPTTATLELAIHDANTLAAGLRPAIVAESPASFDELAVTLRQPMRAALDQLNQAPLARPGRPKTSLVLSPFFAWAGVDGMTNPIALESLLNPDLLPYERPFVLAHEWAHLAGRGDEAEASAVGWLACMNGPQPLAYSASLYLISEGAAALPPDSRRRAVAELDPGVRADLAAIGRRLQREKPQVQQAASQVYDRYLKANRVADGNASYSRALALILSDPIRGALDRYRTQTK